MLACSPGGTSSGRETDLLLPDAGFYAARVPHFPSTGESLQGFRRLTPILAAVALALAAAPAPAAKPARAAKAGKRSHAKVNPRPPAPASATPGESPEMSAWVRAATPNENHAKLARLAGSFSVESRFFAGAGAEPQSSQGTAEQTMILGGRVLRQEFTGNMGGQAFQGLGLVGYDNVRGRYYSHWVDGMSTMPLTHEGQCRTPSCELIEFKGEYLDPMTKKKKKSRTTSELAADGHLTFTMFDQDARGKEFKSLELVYTRK